MVEEEKPKNKGGRPPKFKTPEELEAKIKEFYKYCEEKQVPLTIGRLACFLGCDPETIANYRKNEKFFWVIKKVVTDIHAQLEEMLVKGKGSVPGIIFYLKNRYAWSDRQDVSLILDEKVFLQINKPKPKINNGVKKNKH